MPAAERFVHVSSIYKEEILATADTIITSLCPAEQTAIKIMEQFYWVWDITNHEQYEEIKGIVKGINDEERMSLPRAIVLNSIYELGAWCTSIIAKQQDGTIIHGRNLDYPDAGQMRDMTFRAKFVRGGDEVFEAVMFAGIIGVYTGMKPNGFSISQNTRAFCSPDTYPSLAENIAMLWAGYKENSWIIRDALTNCDDYQCAYLKLRDEPQPSFGYNILAGTKGDEGVVLARDKWGTVHEDHLDSANGIWYLVQTNNDHWDTGCDGRCAAAVADMESVSQAKMSHDTLLGDVFMQPPVLAHGTIYNTFFAPSQSIMETIPLEASADTDYSKFVNDQPPTMTERFANMETNFRASDIYRAMIWLIFGEQVILPTFCSSEFTTAIQIAESMLF